LVWNQLTEIQTPPVVTTDFVYVRFIGDRSIQEKDFGRIQIDRIAELQRWADTVKNLEGDGCVKLSIIAANNHYTGFGPGTANIFRNMLGLADAKWEDKEEQRELPPPRRRSSAPFLISSINHLAKNHMPYTRVIVCGERFDDSIIEYRNCSYLCSGHHVLPQ
jgi:hypothetical protein